MEYLKEKIDEDIFKYCFNFKEDISINIFVLTDKNRALLIDTGYQKNAKIVKNDLISKNFKIDKVILSHYHPDHVLGANELNDIEIKCSEDYEENFKNCSEIWDKENEYKRPDKLIKHNEKYQFGKFNLRFIKSKGHSECSLITIINEKYIHVGDLLMNYKNKPALPYISKDGDVKKHIESLEKIINLDINKLLLSHGNEIIGKNNIKKSIDKRINYLKNINEIKDLEQNNILSDFEFKKWHKFNLRNIR
ncbi:MAG: MBL fold metallo-hydrolase [Bacillota bacterium]